MLGESESHVAGRPALRPRLAKEADAGWEPLSLPTLAAVASEDEPRRPRRVTRSGRNHHVVLLQEPRSGRRLPIWIGQETAIEIALRLLGHGPQLARPLGSDPTARLVQALGGHLREVRIDRLTDGTYYAVVVVDGPHGIAEVDARPSDALALALVVGAPVRADRAVVEATETDQTAAERLAAIDSQEAVGAQALLDELTQANERQAPPKPATP